MAVTIICFWVLLNQSISNFGGRFLNIVRNVVYSYFAHEILGVEVLSCFETPEIILQKCFVLFLVFSVFYIAMPHSCAVV